MQDGSKLQQIWQSILDILAFMYIVNFDTMWFPAVPLALTHEMQKTTEWSQTQTSAGSSKPQNTYSKHKQFYIFYHSILPMKREWDAPN